MRALLTATTCIQVVKRPCLPQEPILLAMLISASWQASSASGVYGSTSPADVEAARPDRREQLLQRVAVAALRAPRELVDVVRRQFLSGHALSSASPCRPPSAERIVSAP